MKSYFKKTVLFIALLCFTVPSFSQQSTNYILTNWKMSSGGGKLTSNTYILEQSNIGGLVMGSSRSENYVVTVKDSSYILNVLPFEYSLMQNYPNPFNPETKIKYSLAEKTDVNIKIFNMLGKVIKTYNKGVQSAGEYEIIWDGTNDKGNKESSGIYYYQIVAEGFQEIRKMMLLK